MAWSINVELGEQGGNVKSTRTGRLSWNKRKRIIAQS